MCFEFSDFELGRAPLSSEKRRLLRESFGIGAGERTVNHVFTRRIVPTAVYEIVRSPNGGMTFLTWHDFEDGLKELTIGYGDVGVDSDVDPAEHITAAGIRAEHIIMSGRYDGIAAGTIKIDLRPEGHFIPSGKILKMRSDIGVPPGENYNVTILLRKG